MRRAPLSMTQTTTVADRVSVNLDRYTLSVKVVFDEVGNPDITAMLYKNYMSKASTLVYQGTPKECLEKLDNIIMTQGQIVNNTFVF